MKLPFIQRKKYDAIQNKNMKLMKDKANLNDDLEVSNNELKKLVVENLALKKTISDKEKQLKLANEYSDSLLNKNCELNTKLVADETKNEELKYKLTEACKDIDFLESTNKELKDKIKELEFCLEETKKENRKSIEIIKRTNIVKNLLVNLTVFKDEKNRMLIDDDGRVLTRKTVEANKVYDISRLLG